MRLENRLVVALLSLFLIGLFFWLYQVYVFKNFSYLGFGPSQISVVKFFGILNLIILLRLAPNNIGIGMLVIAMPATIVAAQEWQTDVAMMLTFYSMFLTYAFFRDKVRLRVREKVLPTYIFYSVTVVAFFAFLATASLVLMTSIDQLYDLRELRKEDTSRISFIIENMFTKVFLPTAIFILIRKRGLTMATVAIVVGIALFLFILTTRKSLFAITVFPLLLPLFDLRRTTFLKIISLGFLFMAALAIALVDTSANFFFSTFLRRLFFTPVMVLDAYTSYFSNHSFTLFGHTFLKALDPETLYLPPLVSDHYLGVVYNANTGAVGNSFAGGGFVGVVFIGIVLGALMFFFIDGGKEHYAYVAAIIFLFSSITNNDIYVLFTSHGFVLLFLLRFLRWPVGVHNG